MTESSSRSGRQQRVAAWVNSVPFQNFILGLIIFNSLSIGLETSDWIMAQYGTLIDWLDEIIVLIFAAEIALKLYAFRWSFFRDSWNIFDLVIVLVALVPSSGVFAIFRTLRIIRALRLLKQVTELRLIIEALIRAMSSIGWISLLLVIIFYIFAVMGTNIFGHSFPDWFGSLGRSYYTLFQIMTLESWSMGIARPVLEEYPHAWLYFVPFILIASYTTVNIFIAVVVNTINELQAHRNKEERMAMEKTIDQENEEVKMELQILQVQLRRMEEKLDQIHGSKT